MGDREVKARDLEDIERSIIKRYRKDIWAKFIKAVVEFQLIDEGDRIAVAISGGKDSLLLAKLIQEIERHGRKDFKAEFIAMDPGYTPEVRRKLLDNCQHLGIPVKVYDSDVFKVAGKLSGENPCYMCARMRRGFLYSRAEELGCNKLALGHHFDDVIETIMLNVLCAGNYKTMMPKLRSDNFENMEIIRPLYYVQEDDIIRFMNYTGLEALDCACTVSAGKIASKRKDVKDLIASLEGNFDNVKMSIFRSAENVDLGGLIGWKDEEGRHSFLDEY